MVWPYTWGIPPQGVFIRYATIMLDTSHWGTPFLIEGWFFRWALCRGILFSINDEFLSHGHPSEEIRRSFSHWSMRHDWHISFDVLYTGVYFLADDGLWGVVILWRWSDFSFTLEYKIWLGDLIGCVYRSIAFSSLLTDVCDDWIKTLTLMRAWVYDHWVFEPCFISFLSPYYLSLSYVLGLKTTFRP